MGLEPSRSKFCLSMIFWKTFPDHALGASARNFLEAFRRRVCEDPSAVLPTLSPGSFADGRRSPFWDGSPARTARISGTSNRVPRAYLETPKCGSGATTCRCCSARASVRASGPALQDRAEVPCPGSPYFSRRDRLGRRSCDFGVRLQRATPGLDAMATSARARKSEGSWPEDVRSRSFRRS